MKHVYIATYQDAAKALANDLPAFELPAVVRLGGTKRYEDYSIEINTAKAVENSVNKLKQKMLLINAGIMTLPLLANPYYPCVVKGVIRSCGTKVFVVNNKKEFEKAVADIKGDYLIESLFEATSEYRLHCTRTEVFFAVKKYKRNPEDIIITHANHYNKKDFPKPRLWKEIQSECLKAMAALDLDIACFDVLYCSKNENKHTFVIAEANTNPELLANTYNAYKDIIVKLINDKIQNHHKLAKLEIRKKDENKVKLTEEQKYRLIENIIYNDYFIMLDQETVTVKL